MTHRVGRPSVASDCERLTAAAPEVDLTPRAAAARFQHPVGTAKGIKRRRVGPNIGERMVAHRPEFKPRDALGSVAWQHLAHGCDVEGTPSPAADAWLGQPCVVIRHDGVDDDLAVMLL